MKTNLKFFLVLLASSMTLVGCKTNKVSVAEADRQSGFQEQALSPVQEYSLMYSKEEFRAYGTGESPDDQLALNVARAQGIAALQEKIQTNVKAGLDKYTDQTKVDDQLSIDQKTRNQIQTAVKGIIQGASVGKVRKLYDSERRIYKYEVCMVYDKAGVLNVMEQQSQRILRNRERFEKDMKNAWDELDRANGVIPVAEEAAARKNEMEQSNLDREADRTVKVLEVTPTPPAPAPAVSYLYTISIDGKNYGPYSYDQLRGMVPNRQFTKETYVWREGMADWLKAKDMPELQGLFSPVPPPAPRQ